MYEKVCQCIKSYGKMIIDTPQKPMTPLTDEENRNHEKSNICNEEFIHDKENEKYREYCKVRGPCHCTGKYRGAAHSKCNLQYKYQRKSL